MEEQGRIVSWFSCGAASAVATKLAIASGHPVTVVYCEVAEEHPDNRRFLLDCEKWFGQKIIIIGNDRYKRSIFDVFIKTKFLSSPQGARCTAELKKAVREKFQRPGDVQVFGYTAEEQGRVDRFIDANNAVKLWSVLVERGLTKSDCLAMIKNAEIELPVMYQLGYKNNNCVGCVKGGAGYWNKVRVDFPDAFQKMNDMEKHLGRTVTKITMGSVKNNYSDIYDKLGCPPVKNEKGKPVYWRPRLDELPHDAGHYPSETSIECGIFCHLAEDEYTQKGCD